MVSLKNDPKCPSCSTKPVFLWELHCGHGICQPCLQKVVDNGILSITCQLCQKSTKLELNVMSVEHKISLGFQQCSEVKLRRCFFGKLACKSCGAVKATQRLRWCNGCRCHICLPCDAADEHQDLEHQSRPFDELHGARFAHQRLEARKSDDSKAVRQFCRELEQKLLSRLPSHGPDSLACRLKGAFCLPNDELVVDDGDAGDQEEAEVVARELLQMLGQKGAKDQEPPKLSASEWAERILAEKPVSISARSNELMAVTIDVAVQTDAMEEMPKPTVNKRNQGIQTPNLEKKDAAVQIPVQRTTFDQGAFLFRLSDLERQLVKDCVWRVDSPQKLQCFIPNKDYDHVGGQRRFYYRTERYSTWESENGWEFIPLITAGKWSVDTAKIEACATVEYPTDEVIRAAVKHRSVMQKRVKSQANRDWYAKLSLSEWAALPAIDAKERIAEFINVAVQTVEKKTEDPAPKCRKRKSEALIPPRIERKVVFKKGDFILKLRDQESPSKWIKTCIYRVDSDILLQRFTLAVAHTRDEKRTYKPSPYCTAWTCNERWAYIKLEVVGRTKFGTVDRVTVKYPTDEVIVEAKKYSSQMLGAF